MNWVCDMGVHYVNTLPIDPPTVFKYGELEFDIIIHVENNRILSCVHEFRTYGNFFTIISI